MQDDKELLEREAEATVVTTVKGGDDGMPIANGAGDTDDEPKKPFSLRHVQSKK